MFENWHVIYYYMPNGRKVKEGKLISKPRTMYTYFRIDCGYTMEYYMAPCSLISILGECKATQNNIKSFFWYWKHFKILSNIVWHKINNPSHKFISEDSSWYNWNTKCIWLPLTKFRFPAFPDSVYVYSRAAV